MAAVARFQDHSWEAESCGVLGERQGRPGKMDIYIEVGN